MVRIRLAELSQGDVLAGSASGAEMQSRLIGLVNRITAAPTIVVLDFADISVATSSFLRESVLGFRDYCRRSRPNLYPIVANLQDMVAEELHDLLQRRREALVACAMNTTGAASETKVIGTLEEKQRVTLEAVLELKEADASTLADRFSATEKIGATGWNNRLAALAASGILMEVRSGRAKKYRPVLEGLKHGA